MASLGCCGYRGPWGYGMQIDWSFLDAVNWAEVAWLSALAFLATLMARRVGTGSGRRFSQAYCSPRDTYFWRIFLTDCRSRGSTPHIELAVNDSPTGLAAYVSGLRQPISSARSRALPIACAVRGKPATRARQITVKARVIPETCWLP